MRVLVTGSDGYIGQALVPMLQRSGHSVVGVDAMLFHRCSFGESTMSFRSIRTDIRDHDPAVFQGIDAVLHLAAISNDPLGDLNPECTYDINHRGTVRLAEMAKSAGVRRFLYSSSCSLYGAQGDSPITENYQIRDVARIVDEIVPDSTITLSDESFNDPRNYRVTCDRIAREIPSFKPQWTVRRGVEQLYRAFTQRNLTLDQLEGDRFMRVKYVNRLLGSAQLDSDLRWRTGP